MRVSMPIVLVAPIKCWSLALTTLCVLVYKHAIWFGFPCEGEPLTKDATESPTAMLLDKF
jgi:hypothetical protein